MKRFTLDTHVVPNGKGTWGRTFTVVLDNGEPLSSFVYGLEHPVPWQVFEQNGHPYALFSSDYTATSVMDLETGHVVAKEEGNTWGFCPVEFKVSEDGLSGEVFGCYWAAPYGSCLLDLSKISEGKIRRSSMVSWEDGENTEDFPEEDIEWWTNGIRESLNHLPVKELIAEILRLDKEEPESTAFRDLAVQAVHRLKGRF